MTRNNWEGVEDLYLYSLYDDCVDDNDNGVELDYDSDELDRNEGYGDCTCGYYCLDCLGISLREFM